MEKRELTCIGCPMGCAIEVQLDNGEIKDISGYTCLRGEKYAREEVTDPRRIVTSTAIIDGGKLSRVSVKTESDIPKKKIFDVMKDINEIKAVAPVKVGDVLLEDVAGTGVQVIATRNVAAI